MVDEELSYSICDCDHWVLFYFIFLCFFLLGDILFFFFFCVFGHIVFILCIL